jgi:hypothetical protein
MFGRGMILVLVALTCACASAATSRHAPPTDPRASELVFLTREGCAATVRMRTNVDEALKSLGVGTSYQVIDLDALPASDVRRGYPTPTLLYGNRDVFELSESKPPLPDPT